MGWCANFEFRDVHRGTTTTSLDGTVVPPAVTQLGRINFGPTPRMLIQSCKNLNYRVIQTHLVTFYMQSNFKGRRRRRCRRGHRRLRFFNSYRGCVGGCCGWVIYFHHRSSERRSSFSMPQLISSTGSTAPRDVGFASNFLKLQFLLRIRRAHQPAP